EVDDAVFFLAKFKNGIVGTFEATRSAWGNKEAFSFEINGSKGSIIFNSKQYNKLYFFDSKDHPRIQGMRTIYVGNTYHPYGETPWPYGEVIGYTDLFVYQAYEILRMLLTEQKGVIATFNEALQVQAVIDAVSKSKREGRWVQVEEVLEG
ncbi:gfo/Idh/MocA family oxidoreductase, partial [Thermococci archaeon]